MLNNGNGEVDCMFMKEDIQSSRYFTGLFQNLYTDHRAVFVRVARDINDVFNLENIEDNNEIV